MRKFLLIFTGLALTACVTMPYQVARRNQEKAAEEDQAFLDKRIDTDCVPDGDMDCGYIAKDLFAEIGKIKKQICKPEKLNESECRQVWVNMVSSRFLKAYPYADPNEVNRECAGDPLNCGMRSEKVLSNLEMKVIASHNNGIVQAVNNARNVRAAKALEERQRRNAAVAAAFKNWADSNQKAMQQQADVFNKKTTNCTSNRIGNQVYTNCTGD